MKKILLIIAILSLTAGSWGQISAPVEYTIADTVIVDTVAIDSTLKWPENVQARLDHLMNEPLLKKTQLGLMVYDLTADSVIYCQGEKQTLRPADRHHRHRQVGWWLSVPYTTLLYRHHRS